ncbi:Oligosaccharyl transferase STT3 subunit [uncultured archaeon]|nr:Oligosaccharyl transferase STT3 subunit [uncultured archaeon]
MVEGETKEFVSEKEIEARKQKAISFLKKKINLIVYAILAVIISISVFIRTRNIPKLKDVTTGTWTLGPDLDPFLFLRWAQYIAEHGKLFVLDVMRYVPLANICSGSSCAPASPSGETILLPYLIAWFSKFLGIFDKNVTVTYAAIIFPVVMAVLTGIAFFLFAREIFYKKDGKTANIIALIATAFFVLIPSLLTRTIAGIPEKESAAFFFIFIGLYFFIKAFKSEKIKNAVIFSVLAGISTAMLGLISGFIDFVLVGIAGAVLFSFILGKIDEKKFYIYCIWIAGFLISAMPFSDRFSLSNILNSSTTELVLIVFFILLIDFLIFKKKIFNLETKAKKFIKLPEPIIALIITIVIGIIFSLITSGGSSIVHVGEDIISNTVNPINQGRFSVTVAENKQPYFTSEWVGEFGPTVANIPLYFWLMFIGSVLIFSFIIKELNKKEKIILTSGYVILLFGMIFSKYSSSSMFNGQSFISILLYFGATLLFLAGFAYVVYKRHKAGEFSVFKNFDFSYILYFIIFTLGIISARGAVRLIMVLGAVSPIAVAFLIIKSSHRYLREKEDTKKLFLGIFVLVVLIASIFTLWTYYVSDKNLAENYAPTSYTQQWQKAMDWVRDNTSLTAVFAHWWDYGYWVQSLGERATILDGGNAIGYWDYFMGRNVLTGTDEREALDFLYAHNATNLLIDSTDIGKYGAFSSIGSDANYDRYSWIPTIFLDEAQTYETNNQTTYVYPIGAALDEDFLITKDGQETLLPSQKTGVAGAIISFTKEGKPNQPTIVFGYNGQRYETEIRYVYMGGQLYDFKNGMDAGIFLFPLIKSQTDGTISISKTGAGFYLSKRVINSELTRLYLFNENSNYFKLVHSEDSLIIDDLKKQGLNLGEFVYYAPAGGLQGPIKIWNVSYPSDIKLNSTYLSTDYPEEISGVS